MPLTRAFDSVRDIGETTHDYPLVIKPALAIEERGGRLRGGAVSVCAGEAELKAAVGRYPTDEPVLVQGYLRGTGEGLFGLARDGAVDRWSAHRRVRMQPLIRASLGCSSPTCRPPGC